MIQGKVIRLLPATLDDRRNVYDWCFQSETTKCHSGAPDYPEHPIPTYEEFYSSDNSGYNEYFFTGAKPQDGRGFLIVNEVEAVGFVSYCAFHLKPSIAELDIWLKSEACCGKGYGVDALQSLGEYLHNALGIRELIIAPSIRNRRAVRAYEKAGFARTNRAMREFLTEEFAEVFGCGDYGEEGTAILVKDFARA